MFQGREMIGLQPGVTLARRVQLAVLAHIRHTHTRYDKLLKETSWENARRAVEPICLDFILKWRGDEETGRDQMDEILREVVVITDSEDEDKDDDNHEGNSSEEEGEVNSPESSAEDETHLTLPVHAAAVRGHNNTNNIANNSIESANGARPNPPRAARTQPASNEKKAQRGFARYQAAYNDAMTRRQQASSHAKTPSEQQPAGIPRASVGSPHPEPHRYSVHGQLSGPTENHGQSSQHRGHHFSEARNDNTPSVCLISNSENIFGQAFSSEALMTAGFPLSQTAETRWITNAQK